MTVEILTAALLVAALWSLLCRVNQMQRGITDPAIFVAHLSIGLGLAGGLFLPGGVGKLSMALGVALYLLAGAWRWRYAAPNGTRLDTEPAGLQTEQHP